MEKKKLDNILFKFLETSYHFEKMEENIFNLTWQEIYLLQILKKDGELTVCELANKLNIKQYKATRLIQALQKRKLLYKQQDRIDKRRYFISISKFGIEELEIVEEFNYDIIMNYVSTNVLNNIEVVNTIINDFDIIQKKMRGYKSDK